MTQIRYIDPEIPICSRNVLHFSVVLRFPSPKLRQIQTLGEICRLVYSLFLVFSGRSSRQGFLTFVLNMFSWQCSVNVQNKKSRKHRCNPLPYPPFYFFRGPSKPPRKSPVSYCTAEVYFKQLIKRKPYTLPLR